MRFSSNFFCRLKFRFVFEIECQMEKNVKKRGEKKLGLNLSIISTTSLFYPVWFIANNEFCPFRFEITLRSNRPSSEDIWIIRMYNAAYVIISMVDSARPDLKHSFHLH